MQISARLPSNKKFLPAIDQSPPASVICFPASISSSFLFPFHFFHFIFSIFIFSISFIFHLDFFLPIAMTQGTMATIRLDSSTRGCWGGSLLSEQLPVERAKRGRPHRVTLKHFHFQLIRSATSHLITSCL